MLWKYKCKKKFKTGFLDLYFFMHNSTISIGKCGYYEFKYGIIKAKV